MLTLKQAKEDYDAKRMSFDDYVEFREARMIIKKRRPVVNTGLRVEESVVISYGILSIGVDVKPLKECYSTFTSQSIFLIMSVRLWQR